MSKKLIIMTLGLGVISFAGAFAFTWFTRPSPVKAPESPEQSIKTTEDTKPKPRQIATNMIAEMDSTSIDQTRSMTEQQLKNLMYDLRKKMQEYDKKLQDLKVQEQRLQVTQDVLKEDLERLHNLQVQLTSITANLKSEREKLLKSRIEIDKNEQVNLVSIAATYDKMDASSASKILSNMCSPKGSKTEQINQADRTSGSFNDAVKILYYMSERTKAKLLAELAVSEPQLASSLSQRLKQIVEVN